MSVAPHMKPISPAAPLIPPVASRDFTAQVMARLAAPAKPDPEVVRRRRVRARAAGFARFYMTLALLLALGVALVAWFAPGALAGAFAYVIALMFDVFSGVAFAQRSTGGFISWSSALYALMLVALIPMLALLRRRARRQRSHPDE